MTHQSVFGSMRAAEVIAYLVGCQTSGASRTSATRTAGVRSGNIRSSRDQSFELVKCTVGLAKICEYI